MGRNGIVATSTALAAQAGLRILQAGGNAFDAAVAMASTLGVTEPFDVGPGADLYPLLYVAKENKVYQLTDGGPAPSGATLAHYNARGYFADPKNWAFGTGMPPGILAATVPAAVWGWDEVVRHFGKLSLKEDLTPAIEYAEQGFPIQEGDAASWSLPNSVDCHPGDGSAAHPLYQPFCNSQDPDSIAVWYPNGVKPVAGQIFKNPDMAHTLRLISDYGREVFYKGEIAQAIVAKSNQLGGTMTLSDLANYKGEWVTPAHGTYHGFDIYATTAPSQSWASIEELNILEACVPGWTGGKSLAQLGPTNPLYWHLIIEAKKVAYADLYAYNGDPDFVSVPLSTLLSKSYAATLCGKVDPTKASTPTAPGNIPGNPGVSTGSGSGGSVSLGIEGDTIYGTTADRWGNMASWINSNYSGFGTGITVPGYGFVFCNRLQQFKLIPGSPDVIAPHKRPYNTISSNFVMLNGKPLMTQGMPGGDQQAQGNMQVLLNVLDLGANAQAAIDMARFTHAQVSNVLGLEPNLYKLVGAALTAMGHTVHNNGSSGGGQAIVFQPDPSEPEPEFEDQGHGYAWGETGVSNGKPINGYYRAGSNFRQDGQAVGY
jgi:gamma-glutamyltranspeptidase/glutathione hydrolase